MRFLSLLAVLLPLICQAQTTRNISFFTEGDNVIITYDLDADASSITLFLSENDGDWQQLSQVSGDVGENILAGNKRIVWDIYKEKKKGVSDNVRFAVVPNYTKPSKETLPDIIPQYGTVIKGHKAYTTKEKNYKKEYAGDIRKGTWASATDNISFDVEVYEYDFITKDVRLIDSISWSGRVARKEPSGAAVGISFPVVKVPPFRLNIDKKGRVCLDKRIIAN